MDSDIDDMSREELLAELIKLRNAVRAHRDSSGHELCWHHPALWNLLPEQSSVQPVVPEWPVFLRGCLKYRQSLDEQLPDAPRSDEEFSEHGHQGAGMKVKTTVLCLPVTDLQKTLGFYKGVFGFGDAQIDGDMIALELPNLSLFLMTKESYESYTKKAGRDALMPGASAPAVMSCAVETKEDVDQALGKTAVYGGASAGPAAIDAVSGGYIGYVTDPDGHLWELVCPQQE